MRIIENLKVGDKVWLGETQYEITGQPFEILANKRKKMRTDQYLAKPINYSDRIKALPDHIRLQIEKTEIIILKPPLTIYEDEPV